jgi:hypothetical protein
MLAVSLTTADRRSRRGADSRHERRRHQQPRRDWLRWRVPPPRTPVRSRVACSLDAWLEVAWVWWKNDLRSAGGCSCCGRGGAAVPLSQWCEQTARERANDSGSTGNREDQLERNAVDSSMDRANHCAIASGRSQLSPHRAVRDSITFIRRFRSVHACQSKPTGTSNDLQTYHVN